MMTTGVDVFFSRAMPSKVTSPHPYPLSCLRTYSRIFVLIFLPLQNSAVHPLFSLFVLLSRLSFMPSANSVFFSSVFFSSSTPHRSCARDTAAHPTRMSLTDLRPACRGLQPPNPNPNPNDGRLPHTLSQTFDLLAADFNHLTLTLTLTTAAYPTLSHRPSTCLPRTSTTSSSSPFWEVLP
jgi:hypothetical protein